MPFIPFILAKLAKDVSYVYRARSVEAIRLCRTLVQEPVTRNGFKGDVHDVHNLRPSTLQNVGLPQPEYIFERFLNAAWDAIQLACINPEKDPDTDRAFESLSDLLRGYSNQDFILSIEGLERAKQEDERKSNLVERISARFKRMTFNNQPQKMHIFRVYHGGGTTRIDLKVDYPPQVHALTWRLKQRCSDRTPLRLPHFYPDPFIQDLTDDVVGRPLGYLGGQGYGLKLKLWPEPRWPEPREVGWMPCIDVYGDDPTGSYFKLDSGGFSSTFRSTINLANPRRVIFRDIFGQLLTQKAMEDVVTKVGNANEIKYSVWSDTTLHTEVRTLKDIAEIPFINLPASTSGTSLPHPSLNGVTSQEHPPQKHAPPIRPPPIGGQDHNIPATFLTSQHPANQDLQKQSPSPIGQGNNISTPPSTFPPGLDSQRPVAEAGERLPDPSRTGDVQFRLATPRGPRETPTGSSKTRASSSNPGVSHGPPWLTLSPRNSETPGPLSSPEEFSHQSPQGICRPAYKEHDSGYFSVRSYALPTPHKPPQIEVNQSSPAPHTPVTIPGRKVEGINNPPVLPQRIATDSTATHSSAFISGPNQDLRIDTGSRSPGASNGSVRLLPQPPTGLPTKVPPPTPQTPRFFSTKRGKVKGIAAGIVVASSGATSLLPTTLQTFPDTDLKLEIPESWVKRHIVTPVKKMVRKD